MDTNNPANTNEKKSTSVRRHNLQQEQNNQNNNNINNNNNNNNNNPFNINNLLNHPNQPSNPYTSYWDTSANIPEELQYEQDFDEDNIPTYHDRHDYYNPYGKKRNDYDIINDLKESSKQILPPKSVEINKYDSLARKVEKPKAKHKQPRDSYMNDIVKLVGSNANRDVVRNNNLVSKNGALMWIDKNHQNQGWKVVENDEDGDGIPEVMVFQPDDKLYSMNGYMVKKSDMGSRQPYYNAFPTREERQQAREEGITMSNFGALRFKPKPLDPNNPYTVEYENDPYEDKTYLKQLVSHRAPHVPFTRSPYQVFTRFIAKTIWENFKRWLGTTDKTALKYVQNTGNSEKPKWEFINHRKLKQFLVAEDMISYSAFAYEKYVKAKAFKAFEDPNIYKKAFGKLQLKLANARARVEVNPDKTNKEKLKKIETIFNDDVLLQNEMVKIISNSEAFKETCENIVKDYINNKRQQLVNALFNELIQNQLLNEKEILAARTENRSLNEQALIKMETTQQKLKRLAFHEKI